MIGKLIKAGIVGALIAAGLGGYEFWRRTRPIEAKKEEEE